VTKLQNQYQPPGNAGTVAKRAAASVVLTPLMQNLIVSGAIAGAVPALNAVAGIDRVTVLRERPT